MEINEQSLQEVLEEFKNGTQEQDLAKLKKESIVLKVALASIILWKVGGWILKGFIKVRRRRKKLVLKEVQDLNQK